MGALLSNKAELPTPCLGGDTSSDTQSDSLTSYFASYVHGTGVVTALGLSLLRQRRMDSAPHSPAQTGQFWAWGGGGLGAAAVAEGALRAGRSHFGFCRTHTARGSFSSQSQTLKCVILVMKNPALPFQGVVQGEELL